MGVYRLGYYPHNVHFVMASAQLAGDGQTVIAAAEKLSKLIPDEAARGIAMVQPVKAAPYFAHAQFSTPETILALPDPGDFQTILALPAAIRFPMSRPWALAARRWQRRGAIRGSVAANGGHRGHTQRAVATNRTGARRSNESQHRIEPRTLERTSDIKVD